jgi:hypothetical protein
MPPPLFLPLLYFLVLTISQSSSDCPRFSLVQGESAQVYGLYTSTFNAVIGKIRG